MLKVQPTKINLMLNLALLELNSIHKEFYSAKKIVFINIEPNSNKKKEIASEFKHEIKKPLLEYLYIPQKTTIK